MISTLAHNWWMFVVRGILALLFGVAAIVWPDLTILTLTYVFGFYALFDGVLALIAAFSNRGVERWWVLLLEGLLGIAAGVIAFVSPDVTALALLTVIALWAILTGGLEIWAAIQLRKEIDNEWWLGLGGLSSIVFGVLLLIWPASGLVTISWIIGFYALFFGISYMMAGFRLQGLNKTIKQQTVGAA